MLPMEVKGKTTEMDFPEEPGTVSVSQPEPGPVREGPVLGFKGQMLPSRRAKTRE